MPKRQAPSAKRQALAWLCAALGAVLLTTAALKGHSLLTDFVPGKTLLLSRPVQFVIVELELGIGLWLVSGVGLVWAARAGAVFFTALAGASGWLLASGAECCGCLGRLAVSPWFSFAFNLAAITALSVAPTPPPDEEPSRPGRVLTLSALFVFLGVLLPVAGWQEPVPAGRSRTLGAPGALVVLDTENWAGGTLPVVDHIDVGERLRQGTWTIIFYHRDCPRCQQLIEKLAGQKVGGQYIALIEVPPLNGQAEGPVPEGGWTRGRLSTSRRWVVDTPKAVRVQDGIVQWAGSDLANAGLTSPGEEVEK